MVHKGLKFFVLMGLFAVGFLLQACQTGRSYPYVPPTSEQIPQAQSAPSTLSTDYKMSDLNAAIPSVQKANVQSSPQSQIGFTPVKVGILLPLSGDNAALGQAMLNAAQMALFDLGHQSFELIPRDTGGTAQGGANAAYAAIRDGAQILLGPVFSSAVGGAKGVANSNNVNMIAFSTNWGLAGDNVFLMGFLPFDQVDRVIEYASARGLNNIGALAPQTEYGQIALQAYRTSAPEHGIHTGQLASFSGTYDLPQTLAQFTGSHSNTDQQEVHVFPYQAVFLPSSAGEISIIAEEAASYGMTSPQVQFLGTGLWDDPNLARNPMLNGSWFAAPDPNLRSTFEARYLSLYAQKPPRIATLAYDSAALTAILAQAGLRQLGQPAFDKSAILNPNGFAGVDGIFRFRPDGIAERGLAVLQYSGGRIQVIDPAPETFQ